MISMLENPDQETELVNDAAAVVVIVSRKTTVPEGGADQVASPRQNVVEDAEVPLPRFVTGRLPVTPVVRGSPVAFVRVPEAGVPSAPPL